MVRYGSSLEMKSVSDAGRKNILLLKNTFLNQQKEPRPLMAQKKAISQISKFAKDNFGVDIS